MPKADELDEGGDRLGPKVWRKRVNVHPQMSLKKFMMLALSHAILSMSTRIRELSKSTLLSKDSQQQLGDIFSTRVITKYKTRRRELIVNHGMKTLI